LYGCHFHMTYCTCSKVPIHSTTHSLCVRFPSINIDNSIYLLTLKSERLSRKGKPFECYLINSY
jgi:hypothetical protein